MTSASRYRWTGSVLTHPRVVLAQARAAKLGHCPPGPARRLTTLQRIAWQSLYEAKRAAARVRFVRRLP